MPRPHRPLFRAGLALVATALLGALPVVTPTPLLAEANSAPVSRTPGYWLVGGDGSVYPFGSASDRGSLRGKPLSRPVVGMAATPSGAGYWMVGSDGGIFSFGDAGFHGSTGALKLNQPIVGMAATPSGKGYWFVAADGGIFSFGDAGFHGSTGNLKLNKPIVGMAPTPSGKGYWFVASDGGIFSFGDAAFYGSTGAMTLAKPITGMAASPSGQGYWFVASDGGIFNFGDAAFLGSAGSTALPAGIVIMSAGLLPSPGTTPTNPTTPTTGPGPSTTATTGPPPTGAAFEMALVGDSGYAASQYETFDRVVGHMNTFPLSFVVHDGDFKDPQTSCSDSKFNDVKASFNKSKAPFVYVAGDNEWMDCNKNAANPMDPVERLGKLREVFFAQDQSLGQNPMPLTTQRQRGYPENTRWTKEGVVFATLNTPGPSDNLPYDVDHPTTPEAGPRRQANRAWLRETFQFAKDTNAPAVMIIWQVDAWQPQFRRTWDYLLDWSDDPNVPDSVGPELKQLTIEFGKPVVLAHGDTHVFRIDKGGWPTPRPDGTTEMKGEWADVPNFTRVETWAGGSFSAQQPEVHPDMWIRVAVDPKSPQVFTFTSQQAP